MRRRREEEDRIAQQNEFLRASLRGSRKLQALQEQDPRSTVGVENDAFIADDEGERIIGKHFDDFIHKSKVFQTFFFSIHLNLISEMMNNKLHLFIINIWITCTVKWAFFILYIIFTVSKQKEEIRCFHSIDKKNRIFTHKH